ncbi:MAG: MerR family transcriptional regulator [Rikenellaceae bacterium]|nr:MerR family transcriptional regulator [Rikenellaceae bacterium]
MGEVAEMFDVNQSLIRFWEQRFKILKPKKNKKGNRLFTPEDIKNLDLIYYLVKERGMTLSGAERCLKEQGDSIERDAKIVHKLQEIKSILLEVKEELRDDNPVYRESLKRTPQTDKIGREAEDIPGIVSEESPVTDVPPFTAQPLFKLEEEPASRTLESYGEVVLCDTEPESGHDEQDNNPLQQSLF